MRKPLEVQGRPLEILAAKGSELGLNQPWQFIWSTGGLSGVLDNGLTYALFFQTVNARTHQARPGVLQLLDGNFIRQHLLVAISLGTVCMGANTHIGTGPYFMVKPSLNNTASNCPVSSATCCTPLRC